MRTIRNCLLATFLLNVAVLLTLTLFAPRGISPAYAAAMREWAQQPAQEAAPAATQLGEPRFSPSAWVKGSEIVDKKKMGFEGLVSLSITAEKDSQRWDTLLSIVRTALWFASTVALTGVVRMLPQRLDGKDAQ